MSANYTTQDRGSKDDYQHYLEAMDAISIEKVASASVFFEPKKGNTIVDVGMASGTSSAILAHLFPSLQIIGVDINPKMVEIAQNRYHYNNLSFQVGDGEKLSGFKRTSIDGFFNCSSIHHITSYNGYASNHALETLERQVELLKEGGTLVVRDFVKPEEKEIILELSTEKKKERPDDCTLLVQFAQTARSLAPEGMRGFPIEEIETSDDITRRFRLFYSDAVEFIRRKDYYDNWDVELQEEYAYFTQSEFETSFRNLGLRIIISAPIYNQWIINNRYRKQFRLFDISGKQIGFPPTNYLIAGEKTRYGKSIQLIRHLPQSEKPFLHYSSYSHKGTGEVFDVVERPNEVYDVIPYHQNGKDVTILIKNGYPRPFTTIRTDSPVLDNKHFSGYIPEGISVAKTETLAMALNSRFEINEKQYVQIEDSLTYYTTPGGINEKVSSVFIELHNESRTVAPLKQDCAGFVPSGTVRSQDAVQLLNTAQTGALVEARLELNIYCLLNKLQIKLPKWLGEEIQIEKVDSLQTTSLSALLQIQQQMFSKNKQCAGFLRRERASFSEWGIADSENCLEYVYPKELSSNTLITLPICDFKGQIYVGLEMRDLPVPQIQDGNSTILTTPAIRLKKDVDSFFSLNNFISAMEIGESRIKQHYKLGEKYYPSIGVTTEQVYPYVVSLDSPSLCLQWIDLNELLNNQKILKMPICSFV